MKKLLACAALVVALALAQNPNSAKFPAAVATDDDLPVASNRFRSTLSAGINASTLTVPVADASTLTVPAVVTVGPCTSTVCEHMMVCSKNGNTLTVCAAGRGFSGSTAQTHVTGEAVTGTISSYTLNQVTAELKAIETALGVSLGNVASSSHAHASTDLTDTAGIVRGAASLSTPGYVPMVDVAGALKNSSIFCNATGGGNVGIGTASPASKLTVAAIPYQASRSGGIRLQSAGGEHAGELRINTTAGGAPYFSITDFKYGGPTTDMLSIVNSTVGINRVDPSYTLDVNGTFRASSAALQGTTYKVTLSPSASQTADYTLTWPTEQGTANQTLINDGSGNLSWGTTSAAAEWPLKVTRTSTTVLTVASGNVRFGSTSYTLTGGTATITAGTGTAYVYVASDGTLTVASNVTVTCSGCTATSGTSFPTDSIPLYTWTATSTVWDASGSTDYRALLSAKKISAGTGISVSEANGHATVAIDSSVDPYSKRIWIQAVNCDGTTASLNWDTLATLKPTAACTAGTTNTGLMRGVAQFSNSEISQMQTHFALPSTWGGAMDVKLKWQTSATSGSVVWQVATVCVADGEVNDTAWNTASTVTDAAKGTTLQTNDATITGVTVTGCAAGELMHLKVFRDPDHASDDLAATADLIGVEITLGIQ